jgi:uncharacterized protein YecA (UPF0149 family)
MSKVRRNDRCLCGSGQKYKHCCMDKNPAAAPAMAAEVVGQQQASAALAEAESSLLVHLELYACLGNSGLMAVAYRDLGTVYRALGDFAAAEAMHAEALKLEEALGRKTHGSH